MSTLMFKQPSSDPDRRVPQSSLMSVTRQIRGYGGVLARHSRFVAQEHSIHSCPPPPRSGVPTNLTPERAAQIPVIRHGVLRGVHAALQRVVQRLSRR